MSGMTFLKGEVQKYCLELMEKRKVKIKYIGRFRTVSLIRA